MIKHLCTLLLILAFNAAEAADNLILTNLKNTQTECDYLVIAPDSFLTQALRLVNLHFNNKTPDVLKPKITTLSTIYKQFKNSDTMYNCNAIKNALHWAHTNWKYPFTYVVLIGDDSVGTFNATNEINRGPMPSFTTRVIEDRVLWNAALNDFVPITDTSFSWNDYQYSLTAIDSREIKSLFMVARIPCETNLHLKTYIDNLIKFQNQSRGPWMNKAIFLTDDDYQYNAKDMISFSFITHMQMSDMISSLLFKGFFINKIYSAFYQLDDKMQFSLVTDDYLSSIKNGSLFTLYFGHGHYNLLSDERILTGRTISRFDNKYINGCFVSLSCLNAAYFEPFSNSMCKQFLFTPSKGYAVYIGSTSLEWATSNEALANSFFSAIDTLKDKPLGYQWWKALDPVYAAFGIHNYSFLGDPAVYFTNHGYNSKINRNMGNQQLFNCKPELTSCHTSGSYYYQVSSIDSQYPLDGVMYKYPRETIIDSSSGSFENEFSIKLPNSLYFEKLKITVFAWNDSSSWRGELILDNNAITGTTHNIAFVTKQALSLSNNTLFVNNLSDIASLEIFTLSGKLIHTQSVSSGTKELDLKKLAGHAGYYIIKVNDSRKTFSAPFIIK